MKCISLLVPGSNDRGIASEHLLQRLPLSSVDRNMRQFQHLHEHDDDNDDDEDDEDEDDDENDDEDEEDDVRMMMIKIMLELTQSYQTSPF